MLDALKLWAPGVGHVSDIAMANALRISRYHHIGHCHGYATVPPLCSGQGSILNCSLYQIHGYPMCPTSAIYIYLILVGDEEKGSDSAQCRTDLSHTEQQKYSVPTRTNLALAENTEE